MTMRWICTISPLYVSELGNIISKASFSHLKEAHTLVSQCFWLYHQWRRGTFYYMVGEILSYAEAFDFKLSDIEPIDK